jgi:hypothetical protein
MAEAELQPDRTADLQADLQEESATDPHSSPARDHSATTRFASPRFSTAYRIRVSSHHLTRGYSEQE